MRQPSPSYLVFPQIFPIAEIEDTRQQVPELFPSNPVLLLHLLLALFARINVWPVRVRLKWMRTLAQTFEPFPRLPVELVRLVAQTDAARRTIKREEEGVGERLLRLPEPLFPGEAEGLVPPRETVVGQQVFG